MTAVAVLSHDELQALLEDAAERGAERALARSTPAAAELDTAAAAELARVTPDTIRDWVKRRGLPARRPPGARDHRIARADLLAFLASPTKRRPPKERAPVDLSATAEKMLHRSRRG